jgi:CRISPR-associated protein (Cas_Cas02710).
VIAHHVLPNADDAAAFRARAAECMRALRQAGATRVAVDTTGGKVPMSLGLFMAAEETGATTLYVSAEFDPALKAIRPGSQRLVAVTTPT